MSSMTKILERGSWKCPKTMCFIKSDLECRNACAYLHSESVLAFGLGLGSFQISTEDEKFFLFQARNADEVDTVMNNGLRMILESPTQKKLVWDCREYSRSLSAVRVTLLNVVDIQVLHFKYCTPFSDYLSDISTALAVPGAHIIGCPIERDTVQDIVHKKIKSKKEVVEFLTVRTMYLHRMHTQWSPCMDVNYLMRISSIRLETTGYIAPSKEKKIDFKLLLILSNSDNDEMRKSQLNEDHKLDLEFKEEIIAHPRCKSKNAAEWKKCITNYEKNEQKNLFKSDFNTRPVYIDFSPPREEKITKKIKSRWTCPLVVFIESEFACKYACDYLSTLRSIAIDIEWVVKYDEQIPCTLQIATYESDIIYLFDFKKRKDFMRNGLRQILESRTQKKLLWDCRGDTRILLDSFKVKLENVVDIQVLFYEKYRSNSDFLPEFLSALEKTPIICSRERSDAMKIKEEGKDAIGTMDQRPLPEALVNYCAIDVMYLHCMWNEWGSSLEEDHMALIITRRLSQGSSTSAECDFKDLLTPTIKWEFDYPPLRAPLRLRLPLRLKLSKEKEKEDLDQSLVRLET